jgi:hypothetical protein
MNVIKLNNTKKGIQYIATNNSLANISKKRKPILLAEDIAEDDAIKMQGRLSYMLEEDKAEMSNRKLPEIPWVLA